MLARNTDPDTSHAAGESVKPSLPRLRQQVLRYAMSREPQGFTDVELSLAFNCTGSTYRSRRAELVASGHLVDSGQRRTHEGGRKHILWRVKNAD